MPIPTQKVLVIPLFTDLFLQTDGTTSYVHAEIECPQLEGLGPYIEEMSCLTVTRNRTSDHEWTVNMIWSNTGRAWSSATAMFTDITSDGEDLQAPYSTAANFAGLHLKLLASCKNGSAGSRVSPPPSREPPRAALTWPPWRRGGCPGSPPPREADGATAAG